MAYHDQEIHIYICTSSDTHKIGL